MTYLILQASGVALTDECLNVYLDLQSKKKYRYIIYKLSDDFKEIVVDFAAPRDDSEDGNCKPNLLFQQYESISNNHN